VTAVSEGPRAARSASAGCKDASLYVQTRTRRALARALLITLPGLAVNLIIRYSVGMRTVTATDASRHFSELLDAVERGETVTIVRGSSPVAEIGPARRRTGADLRAALAGTPPPDDAFARSIAEAVSMVTSEVGDPWADD
jgi:prevent-host-death family protein